MDASAFRHRMSQLPEPKTDKKPPYWEFWRLDLWQRTQTQDPTRFWEWPCIYHTMRQAHWPLSIDYELSQLDLSRWQYALQIPCFGPEDNLSGTRYSMNLIHQAYHLTQWEQAADRRIEQLDTIVEFGGGYGAMALLCHRLGFDMPMFPEERPKFWMPLLECHPILTTYLMPTRQRIQHCFCHFIGG